MVVLHVSFRTARDLIAVAVEHRDPTQGGARIALRNSSEQCLRDMRCDDTERYLPE